MTISKAPRKTKRAALFEPPVKNKLLYIMNNYNLPMTNCTVRERRPGMFTQTA